MLLAINNLCPSPYWYGAVGNLFSRMQKIKAVFEFCLKHWFLIGLFVAIGLAAANPDIGKKGGTIRSEITVTFVGVGLIFVLSGLSLKTKALTEALLYARLIVFVQSFSLIFIPAVGYGLGKFLMWISFDASLSKGLIVACAIPTTISSNVLMTKQAGGNEAAALINAVIGSILGVFVSPALIYWFLGLANSSNPVDYNKVFINLAITVVGPLIFGQIIRYLFPKQVEYTQKYVSFSIINSSLLLLLVYQVFCETFASSALRLVPPASFVIVFFIVLILFLIFSLLAFLLSRLPQLRFTKPDSIAIVMCSATKSAALGIPLINVLFANDPNIGIITIPLLMYHAEQLLAGSFIVTWFKHWMNKMESEEVELENGVVERPSQTESRSLEDSTRSSQVMVLRNSGDL